MWRVYDHSAASKLYFNLKILCFQSWIFSKQMQKHLPCETRNFKQKSNRWSNPLFFRLLPINPNSDKLSKPLGWVAHWKLSKKSIILFVVLFSFSTFPFCSLSSHHSLFLSSFWGQISKRLLSLKLKLVSTKEILFKEIVSILFV